VFDSLVEGGFLSKEETTMPPGGGPPTQWYRLCKPRKP
jgi:hypothetical protein